MLDVVPASLPKTYRDIEWVAEKTHSFVSRIQVDISDGVYTHTKTWPYSGDDGEFDALKKEERGLPFWKEVEYELDMMVTNPEEVFMDWIRAGMSALIFHFESIKKEVSLDELIAQVKEQGVEVGLALLPSTPNESLAPYLETIDFVQCMGNDRIGKHGVSLDERVYEKIVDLRKKFSGIIAVDIGVSKKTAPLLISAGATKFATYSALFGKEDIAKEIRYFQNLI